MHAPPILQISYIYYASRTSHRLTDPPLCSMRWLQYIFLSWQPHNHEQQSRHKQESQVPAR